MYGRYMFLQVHLYTLLVDNVHEHEHEHDIVCACMHVPVDDTQVDYSTCVGVSVMARQLTNTLCQLHFHFLKFLAKKSCIIH